MSYQTYITEAIVVGNLSYNGADKTFLLFTAAAGLIYATARSVREERSRQRYALQDFSLVRVSLIKGKSGWRIGSIDCLDNVYFRATDRLVRQRIVRVTKLLRQYVRGEESDPAVYHEYRSQLSVLSDPALAARADIEMLALVRLLYRLGYVGDEPVLANYLTEHWSSLPIDMVPMVLPALTHTYKAAQHASHLAQD